MGEKICYSMFTYDCLPCSLMMLAVSAIWIYTSYIDSTSSRTSVTRLVPKKEIIAQGEFIEQTREQSLKEGMSRQQVEGAINEYIKTHLGIKPASFSKVYSYYKMEEAKKDQEF